jgi:ubiquitin-protein ligase E3 A
MHIDAMKQMSLEFEDAFVHQALVIHAQRFLHDSVSVASFEQGMEAKTNPYLVLEVRCLRLVDDVLEQVAKKRDDLKKPTPS